ncbi:hypothetical protein VIGAN_08317200 [Vigna angularis var. angularis]|uniref:Uncharacterized protein n=1 Tax=Vigna angularis var. angularis TaxID=157739 RepID=A0A0S3STV2_PHAAN|nr:hypothetical protein VIGAN_08317200 [Vigna angularis var. angularis]
MIYSKAAFCQEYQVIEHIKQSVATEKSVHAGKQRYAMKLDHNHIKKHRNRAGICSSVMKKNILKLYLRIMHVIPWGQKNPSQHASQFRVLAGISCEFTRSTCWLVGTLHAHPGSQPDTHEFKLQFLLGFK